MTSIKNAMRDQRRKVELVLDKRQPAIKNILARMGDGLGNLRVSGENGKVWITINGHPYKALCSRVIPAYSKEVWVGVPIEGGASNVYQVISDNFSNATDPAIIQQMGYAPASRYEAGGDDPIGIDLRIFRPLRLGMSESGGMNVDLYEGFVIFGDDRYVIERQDIDLSAQVPTTPGKAAYVLITIDNTGAVVQTKGAEVDLIDLSPVLTPLINVPAKPNADDRELGAVRVYYGQTRVRDGANTDFIDFRFASGGSGGSGGGGGGTWGTITGDIQTQADLQSLLSALGHGANQFKVEGSLVVVANASAKWLITGDTRIEYWYIACDVLGSASSVIVDVNKNGTTVFTTQANRPTLAYNDANGWAISGLADIIDFVAGDVISIDIDQIATGAADMLIAPKITTMATALKVGAVNSVNEIAVTGATVTNEGGGKVTLAVASVGGGIVQVKTISTRANTIYTAPTTGDGIEITELQIVMTPKKSGNKIILEWVVNGEAGQDTVYIVTRNGTKLPNTTDGSNSVWAGVAVSAYDLDIASTPNNMVVKIIDEDTLNVESTYRLLLRSSSGAPVGLYLNRTVNSTGTYSYETTLSVGTAMEIDT